jgi:hypothetical protein
MSKTFGKIFQNGYIVRDFDSTLNHWIKVFGAGPFYMFTADARAQVYGKPDTPVRMKLAMGYWGDYQIEIIQQLDDTPTPYKDFLDSGREGLQHVASLTEDFKGDDQRLRDMGFKQIMLSDFNGTAIGYYATDTVYAGTMLELVEATPWFTGVLERMRKSSIGWDGKDPIRPFEQVAAG